MKVKVLKPFADKFTHRTNEEGTILNLDETRIPNLVRRGLVEVLEVAPAKAPEPEKELVKEPEKELEKEPEKKPEKEPEVAPKETKPKTKATKSAKTKKSK